MRINDLTNEEKVRLDPKCWTGKKIGNPKTKVKGGVRVNNCVPAESVEEDKGMTQYNAFKREWRAKHGSDAKVPGYDSKEYTSYVYRHNDKKQSVAEGRVAQIAPGGADYSKHSTDELKAMLRPGVMGRNELKFKTLIRRELRKREQQGVAEGSNDTIFPNAEVIKSRNGRPVGEIYQDENGWGFFHYGMDSGNDFIDSREDAIEGLRDLHQETVRSRPDYTIKGVAEEYNPEYDDEAGMADNNLETLRRAVDGLDDLIQAGDNLPEWCQEKIAVAKSMLVAVWDYMESEEDSDEVDPEIDAMFEAMDQLAEEMAVKHGLDVDTVWENFESMDDNMLYETAAWRRKEGKSKSGGLNAKGVASYRRENPGSKLQTAVTTKPSKLKKGSKAAKRRKSFCARMGGVKGPMKKPNGKPTRKALALRKWNC
jgi:hypothetical protein